MTVGTEFRVLGIVSCQRKCYNRLETRMFSSDGRK